MTELQQNRYDQLLRRVGDLKGPGSKVNDVLQELFPTIDVENVPGELLFLMGTRIGWASGSKAPTAGKKAGVQLFNPAGSGQLVTISSVSFNGSTNGFFSYGIVTVALSVNTGVPRLRDGRVGIGPSGVSELRTSADAVSLVSGNIRLATNVTYTLDDRNSVCVLSPGTGFSIIGSTDLEMSVNFNYRERVAEPSELTFPSG